MQRLQANNSQADSKRVKATFESSSHRVTKEAIAYASWYRDHREKIHLVESWLGLIGIQGFFSGIGNRNISWILATVLSRRRLTDVARGWRCDRTSRKDPVASHRKEFESKMAFRSSLRTVRFVALLSTTRNNSNDAVEFVNDVIHAVICEVTSLSFVIAWLHFNLSSIINKCVALRALGNFAAALLCPASRHLLLCKLERSPLTLSQFPNRLWTLSSRQRSLRSRNLATWRSTGSAPRKT